MHSFPVRSLLFVAGLIASAFPCLSVAADPPPLPNMVVILVDDLRWDDIGCAGHPFVKTPHIDRLAREGVLCRHAFATTPLCSPSRASFLTGRYPHAHGILDNTERSPHSHQLRTFPILLRDAGYETGYVGKWHMGNDDTRRPGFDYWVCLKGQGSSHDPELNENGRNTRAAGYVTDLLNERALAFLRQDRARPFLLYLSHKAIHPELTQRADGSISDPNADNFIPAQRHRSLYANATIPRRPNVRDTLAAKPALQRRIGNLPPLGPNTGTPDAAIRNRLRMLAAIDEGVGRILEALQQTGQLDSTLIVFTSDHGYFYGEHGLSVERRLAYEEAIRIPLLMRYPRLIKPGSTLDPFILSVDLAPTLLELGQAPVPANLHGRSFLPLVRADAEGWRTSFLVEYFSDTVFPRIQKMGYQAVRTEQWKYIHYTDLAGMDELYDLRSDPYEMKNVIAEPAAQEVLAQMKAKLSRLLRETDAK